MTVPFDPVTGEVLELDTAQVRAVAAEYVSVLDAIRDGDRELRELQNHLARLADQLEFALGENGSVPAGDNVDVVCLRGTPGIRYNMIRPVPHAVNPDRHARIRAKHFSRAHAMLLARTGAEIVGWDGVRHGLLLRGMGADSELRFVIMAGAAGIARRNSAWGCS